MSMYRLSEQLKKIFEIEKEFYVHFFLFSDMLR